MNWAFAKKAVVKGVIASIGLLVTAGLASGPTLAAPKKNTSNVVALNTVMPGPKKEVLRPEPSGKRYPAPGFFGKFAPKQMYKGLMLIESVEVRRGKPTNAEFITKIKAAIDLIEARSPKIFSMMKKVNPGGRRIIYYTGEYGPATFVSWNNDYIANIPATSIDADPVFDNTLYSLAATLVHELLGHGRQEDDGRVWSMYDWCGQDSDDVEGVLWMANRTGSSSGFVEYEANLFAKWFLESVRGTYPNLNEPAVKRYVKTVRILKKRFPGWYDDAKPTTALLDEFGARFRTVCPGLQYTPHLASAK